MTMKFYWNGIKIDGSELIKCGYAWNVDSVTVYARDYASLPRNVFDVVNESDAYTDYFENDRATLKEGHPLYKYARYAALKAQAHADTARCKWLQEQLAKPERYAGSRKSYTEELESRAACLEAFKALEDPGQPTAEDLAKIDQQRQEAENARREAEQLEEQRKQEEALIRKVEGGKLIEKERAAHPIIDGEPAVLIRWSEHPAFYAYGEDSLLLSVAAADRILGRLDMEEYYRHRNEGYFKTSFRIVGKDQNGEPINYDGRYDLGDGERGLIRHIHNFGSWYLTHDEHGNALKEPRTTNDVVEFAAWLKQFAA